MDIESTSVMIGCLPIQEGGLSSRPIRFIREVRSSITFLFVCVSLFFDFMHRQPDRPRTYTSVRHIPDWLPWFSYQPLIRHGKDLGNKVLYPPIRKVKESMVSDYILTLYRHPTMARKTIAAQRYGTSLACPRESSRVGRPEPKWT